MYIFQGEMKHMKLELWIAKKKCPSEKHLRKVLKSAEDLGLFVRCGKMQIGFLRLDLIVVVFWHTYQRYIVPVFRVISDCYCFNTYIFQSLFFIQRFFVTPTKGYRIEVSSYGVTRP